MIPSDPETIKKLKALADRNIANGDWGDEVSFPGEEVPSSLKEWLSKLATKNILLKHGNLRLRKR